MPPAMRLVVLCVLSALRARCREPADAPAVQRRIAALAEAWNSSGDPALPALEGFVREHRKPALRAQHFYFDPTDRQLKEHILDLMKQAIYGTQSRMQDLQPVIAKYNKSVPFRMSFVYKRLDQLIIDLRRIYTLALQRREQKTVLQHALLYEHAASKHVDVLYLVQFIMETHEAAMKALQPYRDLGDH